MSGFALLVANDPPIQSYEKDFNSLLRMTAKYKQLGVPESTVHGANYFAAKLDSPASIHPGIVQDDLTGSWLMASGTVVALAEITHPSGVLHQLLADFIERGVKALDGYDGHFALAVYNGRENRLSVIADPLGFFAIFYCQQAHNILISTSALAIATYSHAAADTLAIEHYLRTGRQDGDKTLWESVKRLPGGTALHIMPGRLVKEEYWCPQVDSSVSRLSFEKALEQAADLLHQTFSSALQREGKTWVDLTGGFDSRLAAMFVEKTQLPFQAYCMGPHDHPDVQISEKVSKEMGWEYENTQLPEKWGVDQYSWFTTALGCADGRGSVLRLAVTLRGFNERNSAIKTNVMGVGGENWRGYCWQIEKGNIGKSSSLNYSALLDNVFSPAIPIKVMRIDCTQEVRRELSDFVRQLSAKYSDLLNTVKIDRFEISRDSGHGGAYLSAVSGIERSIAPLCFKAPVNYAISLNYKWKYPRHHIFIRKLFERENKRLANLETTTGGPAIPIQLMTIHRFWPLWRDMSERAVAIGSKKLTGKAVHLLPQAHAIEYPLSAWRAAFHEYARAEQMLSYDSMRSHGLYQRDELSKYVEQDNRGQYLKSEFLDRVISVEMAMRAVGSVIE
jgi:hypothetical protein